MIQPNRLAQQYHCPGESAPIGRAIHLGRLARFYPACRRCPHRDQTGTLSPRRVKRLTETRSRGRQTRLFDDEGAAGVYLNDLDPTIAQRMAAALGAFLKRQQGKRPRGKRQPNSSHTESPKVVVAGDGRPIAPEIVAATVEGLRWAGCDVVDLGPATAPSLAFALAKCQAAGGLLVGNPPGGPQTIGLKFWTDGPASMAPGSVLEAIHTLFETPPSRPQRRYGRLSRFQIDSDYLAPLAQHYHALRPLRFVLDTTSGPLVGYLDRLIADTACQILPPPAAAGAHFAVHIDDDGERCRLTDERGCPVTPERLLVLLARHLRTDGPRGPIVLEEGTSRRTVDEIRSLGRHVLTSDPRRAEMNLTMNNHRAILGGGVTGRYWFRSVAGHYAADALLAVSHLLKTLSQTDQPLSTVLDDTNRKTVHFAS